MKKMKLILAGAALLGSSGAFAGATGNAGVFSTYLFRGVAQTAGAAAVQGGVDWSSSGGLYAGTWISDSIGGTGGYETDLYGGWTASGFDIGYIFYGYKNKFSGVGDASTSFNMSEVYLGYSASGFSAKVYYSPEFANTEDDGIYATASYAIPLSGTLSLTPQVGYSTGDGVKAAILGGAEDSYLDYSLTLAKTLDNGFTFSLAAVANSQDDILGTETLVVGLKKGFDL